MRFGRRQNGPAEPVSRFGERPSLAEVLEARGLRPDITVESTSAVWFPKPDGSVGQELLDELDRAEKRRMRR
jgi:hypothetical protein